MERYLKFREEYSRFFYRGYDVEETLNELKITYTFEIEGLSAFTPTWTFPKNGNPEAKWMEDPLMEKMIFSLGMVELVEGDDLWECWGISAHPNGDVTLRDCGFRGMKLSELWKKHPEVFGNVDSDRFPLLIKIIDAKDDLSIQAHPDDDYAKVHENGSLGKTECWYILDCKKNATIVIGHNSRTKEELSRMIHEGKWSEFIREIPIKKGDFLQIDPGTVHAIKGGTLILETQQNSDITYRVYDYDRLSNGKPRELHIDKSIDVITVPAKSVADSVKSVADLPVNTLNELYVCKYFHIYKIEVSGKMTFEQNAPFMNMTVTEGNGIVNGQPVKKGDHFILPNGFGNVELQGRMQIIASTI